jgi:hypothetical protein
MLADALVSAEREIMKLYMVKLRDKSSGQIKIERMPAPSADALDRMIKSRFPAFSVQKIKLLGGMPEGPVE